MSLIIRIPNVTFTDATLPKLYRDSVINTGTKFLYDLVNPVGYPKQAAPAIGSPSADKMVNLLDGVSDGLLTATAGSQIGWGASGGLTTGNTPLLRIQAKNNVAPASETQCVGIVWIKHTAGSGVNSVIANFANMVGLYHSTTNDNFYAMSIGSAARQITAFTATSIAGQVHQWAVAFNNATLMLRVYFDGIEILAMPGWQVLTASTVHQLAWSSGMASGWQGTIYRWLFDNCSIKTAAQVVAADYAANVGRFA